MDHLVPDEGVEGLVLVILNYINQATEQASGLLRRSSQRSISHHKQDLLSCARDDDILKERGIDPSHRY